MKGDDLKNRVLDFATDILTMWRALGGQPAMRSHSATMTIATDAAVSDATLTAEWFGVERVFR